MVMDQFRQGMRNDVKDLLLTLHDYPKSLIEAISWAIIFHNRLFEWCSKGEQMLHFR